MQRCVQGRPNGRPPATPGVGSKFTSVTAEGRPFFVAQATKKGSSKPLKIIVRYVAEFCDWGNP